MKQPAFPVIELSLAEAWAVIAESIFPLPHEELPLDQALGRIGAVSVHASTPSPAFDQSARDGFALASQPLSQDSASAFFRIIGEAAAGCLEPRALAPGCAVRIMTGAPTPADCVRIVPFEACREQGDMLLVPVAELVAPQLHVRRQGRDVQAGQMLAAAGTRLRPDHLLLLAESGCWRVAVHRQPKAVVVCTGSELVRAGEPLRRGQKASSNGVLLAALLEEQGCRCVRAVTAMDDAEQTAGLIRQAVGRDQPDLVVTTGGMGPGKFDATEQAFALLGGLPACNRLRVRPGRATLVGMLGRLPFFALPGPPPAVRLLFHELVAPALSRLQGAADEELAHAALDGPGSGHPALENKDVFLVLKGGVAWLTAQGQLRVRPAERSEPVNAIIHFDGQGRESVKVRLIGPL